MYTHADGATAQMFTPVTQFNGLRTEIAGIHMWVNALVAESKKLSKQKAAINKELREQRERDARAERERAERERAGKKA